MARTARPRLTAAWMVAATLPLLAALGAEKHRAVVPAPPSTLTAVADAYAVVQGKVLAVSAAKGVLANDVPQGKASIALLVSGPSHGALTFNPDGSFTYTNDGTGATSDAFTYRASDGTAASNAVAVTITIVPPGVITTAPDAYSAAHGAQLSVAAPGVLGNDIDPDGLSLSATIVTLPSHGTLAFNANGSFTYLHDGSNTTSDAFSYRASDGTLASAVTTVLLTIGADVPPTVASQSYATTQDTILNVSVPGVLTGAFDPDSPAIAAVLQSGPAHGSVTLHPDGSFAYNPAAGYTGVDSFTYRGSDGIVPSSNTGTASIVISEKCHAITIAPATLPNATAGAVYPAVTFSQSGGAAPILWSAGALPDGMSFSSGGVLSGTPAVRGTFNIDVHALDANGCSATLTAALVINCPAIAITASPTVAPGTLPSGTSGAAYGSVTFTQAGGVGAVVWSIASGSLPAGLTLSSAGTLGGTPSASGNFTFAITATDANGCSAAAAQYTLAIGCQTITVTNPAATSATVLSPLSLTFTQSGGAGATSFSTASALPAGVTLAANGVLAGTPTQTGSFPIYVTATDAKGCSATGPLYLLPVGCAAVSITDPATTTATVNLPFSQSFGAAGVVGAPAFVIASGSLPAGLNLSSNGTLSGTPTVVGTFPITVKATDANSCSGTGAAYNLNVACGTIAVGNPSTAVGATGSPFSQSFSASGASGTPAFTLSSGTLPAGLGLAANGTLSGTPTEMGSFPITVKATDANGCVGTGATYALTIGCGGVTVTNPAMASGSTHSFFSQTFTAAGTKGPYTFALAGGTLPAGLTLATDGTLSGTPAAAGVFTIQVKATDANGCFGTSSNYTLTITCAGITIANPPATLSPAPTVGTPFGVTFTPAGGAPPIVLQPVTRLAYNLTPSFAHPAGIAVDAAGNVYVADTENDAVRKWRAIDNTLSTLPISGLFRPAGVAVDDSGNVYVADTGNSAVRKWTPSGTTTTLVTSVDLNHPAAVAVDHDGTHVYIADTSNNAVKMWTGGALSTLASNLAAPAGVAVDGNQNVYIADTGNDRIEKWSPPGALSTLASGLIGPAGLGTDDAGNVYVAGASDGSIRKWVQSTSSVIALVSGLGSPKGLALDRVGRVFVADAGNAAIEMLAVPPGLTLSLTGFLSGTPTLAGTFPITVIGTDANGCTGRNATYDLPVACQGMAITNPAVNAGTAGVAFSQTFTASGILGTATWSETGVLPSGIALNPSSGVLAGTPTQIGSFPITVKVADTNGCFVTSSYTLTISCQTTITVANPSVNSGTAGVAFSQTFTANSVVGTATWSETGALPSGITLNASTGVLAGTTTQTGSFPIIVKVTDANGCFATSPYTLTINCQGLTLTNPTVNGGTAGIAFNQTFTASGILGTATWSETGALPSGIALNPSSGVLAGTTTQTGSFPITVKVTDTNGCFVTSPYTLTIGCQTVAIANPSVNTGMAGVTFNQSFTATGILGTATWSETGALPAGIALNPSTGVLSGTTTAHSAFPITVKVTDTNGCFATSSYTLTINCQTLAITNPTVNSGTAGVAFNQTFTASGIIGTATWSETGALPSGIALDSSTGVLSGTTTAHSAFPITVKVTDANGCFATSSYTLTINCQTLAIMNPTVNGGTAGVAFNQTFTASGIIGTATWSEAGALPSGIALNPSTGVLSGTTTVRGMFPITVKVSDTNGCFITSAYTLTIACQAITVTNASGNSATLTAGTFFSTRFTASGILGAATFFNANRLPRGVTWSANDPGVLSGTPTQTGNFGIDVFARDSNGCISAVAFHYTLQVNCATITLAASDQLATANVLPGITAGTDVTGRGYGFVPSGAAGTNWIFIGNNLPSGLSIDGQGILSGTVDLSVSGTVHSTISFTDEAGCTAQLSYDFNING